MHNSTLTERLARALPAEQQFKFYHVSTPPSQCPPLFQPSPSSRPQRTFCESHFLNVSIMPPGQLAEVFIMAIEVLVYSTKTLTTLFVSKADSTGYLSLLQLAKGYASPLRTVTTVFLQYLIERRQRAGTKLMLSLFARAQGQYLFPGSVENKTKHVSTDRELVKWWCRIIDPILQEYSPVPNTSVQSAEVPTGHMSGTTAQGYLIIPGEDSHLHFLPPAARRDPSRRARWKHDHPLFDVALQRNAPPRCLIPHFPDDPKARFLDELDMELPDTAAGQLHRSPSKRGAGVWTSVKTLQQFWDAMAFRQECSSGRLVGFLWVLFTPRDQEGARKPRVESPVKDPLGTNQSLPRDFVPLHVPSKTVKQRIRPQPLRGSIIPRLPRIKRASITKSNTAELTMSPDYIWPADSRGSICITEKDYKRAVDVLLHLDYSTFEIAKQSTAKWIAQTAILGSTNADWGFKVTGRAQYELSVDPCMKQHVDISATSVRQGNSPNSPTGDASVPAACPRSAAGPIVAAARLGQDRATVREEANMLSGASIRKKAKLERSQQDTPSHTMVENDYQVRQLSSGLIRKKPKKT